MSDETLLKSDESVVGTRRHIKKDVDFEVVGAKRDAKKVKRATLDTIELGEAGPRQPMAEVKRKRRRRSVKTDRRGFIAVVCATLLMIALTLFVFFMVERYQPVGATLLTGPPFSAGLDDWAKNGDVTPDSDGGEQVTLRNDDPDERVFLKRIVELPPGLTLAYLEATVSTEGVAAGEELWQRARVYLAGLDEAGKPDWTEPHNLLRLRGNNEAYRAKQVFTLPSSVTAASLGIELNNATGAMTVSDLQIYPVEELPGFRQLALGLMVCWAILGVAAGAMLFKGIPAIKLRLGLIAVLGLFAVGLFMSAAMRDALIEGLQFSNAGEGGIEPDMIGHGVAFMIMAALVRLGRPGDSIWLHLGCWMLVAVSSEVLQLFTLDRDPSLADLMVDGIGVILGLSIATYMARETLAHSNE